MLGCVDVLFVWFLSISIVVVLFLNSVDEMRLLGVMLCGWKLRLGSLMVIISIILFGCLMR